MQTCLEHKHDMSGNYHGWSDISGLCSNDVCSESKFHSGRFRAQTWYVHFWQLFSNTTLYTVRLQLYKSCTMMFALVSIIYPRITMVDQYSDIREHLQTFNVDYLGTSKMDISWLCSEHSNFEDFLNGGCRWYIIDIVVWAVCICGIGLITPRHRLDIQIRVSHNILMFTAHE